MRIPAIYLEDSVVSAPDSQKEVSRRVAALEGFDRSLPLLIPARRDLSTIFWIYAAWCARQLFFVIPDPWPESPKILADLGSHQHLPTITNVTSSVHLEEHPQDSALILMSSGSSGQPKLVHFNQGSFLWNARAHGIHYHLSARDRWLASLPFYHVGGLSILLRALILEQDLAFPQTLDSLPWWLESGRVQGVSLVPTQLKRLVDQEVQPRVKILLIGGAGCDPLLQENARKKRYPIVTSYGLTEACAQVYSQSKPLTGVELKVVEDELWIRSPGLALGYWKNGPLPKDESGYFATGDLARWEKDSLTIIGRKSEMVISGGVNISPREIENELLTLPEISEAYVFGVPDLEWGEMLVAAVVAKRDLSLKWRGLLKGRLLAAKVPKEFLVLEKLPRNAMGKISRQQIVELYFDEKDRAFSARSLANHLGGGD